MFRKQKSVGVIGLGIIGSRVAAHLRAAGYTVPVWNRTPKAEPNFLGSPAQVARAATTIQLFVSDATAVFDVLEAMGEALTPRHTILCNATIGLEATREAARRVQERGAKFLDAPFTGSKEAAEKAQLLYYIGGDDAVLEEARPVLEVSGGKGIVKIGGIGQAAVVKVATNVLSAVTVEALAEVLALVKAAGVAPEALALAMQKHGVRSGLTDMKLPKMIEGDFEPHFALKHMLKDVLLGLELGAESPLDFPATRATADAIREGMARGWADFDFSTIVQRYS